MAFQDRGFEASRSLTGTRAVVRRFEVATAANNAFYINQAVGLNTAGLVIPATAAATPLGVVQQLKEKRSDGGERPATHSQPTQGPCLVTGQAGFAYVNVDPNQLYIGRLDVSASAGIIGQNVDTSVAARGNNNTGISTDSLAGSTLSTSADLTFKIVGIAPAEDLDLTGGDKAAGTGVEVKMNFTAFSQTTGT